MTIGLTACSSSYQPISLASANNGVDGKYRLGPGDAVRVTVYGEDKMSGEYEVAGNGSLALPLIGDVPAGGKTAAELAALVRTRLADGGYLLDPQVSAEVRDYRPYYILGEVSKPGEYPYADRLTIFQAVARAGGFTPRADQHRVVLRRSDWAAAREVRLTGDALLIAPGDTIYIQESAL
ncbi:polysaccharide export outer membrane protein [Stakelama sediminis]|uniref:Polysaccharide export outer membrane protein n=1 Tax=Stakelama sediminis TaxID=463200 RepID=A0A840Z2I2_9SPHN|nr:polysaccharide biosynthesis/export family protein [Stakelama sediminis]MBB5719967.1 polysaccharide export outer membrane protein [Stakelama sediminis]